MSKPSAPGAFAAFATGKPQLTLHDIGERMRGSPDYKHRLKWGFEFFRGAADEDADLPSLISDEPALTGDERFDAFLAAAAEYVAIHNDIDAPDWCFQPCRVLNYGWHIAEYEQARRWAYARTPGPFLVRGIYIEERDLINV
ncbi:hypothetical protein [Gordonia malaquae]|uniref:hypothetical protein n=1 Tax=Gordonia malaquae TaxID=410332 RepID=UPI0030190873